MLTCPICGTESPDRYRACGHCGSQLVADRPTEEIRRVATVVTSDWKGSTALGERLDPESLREVQTRYFDAMRTVFESHGGTIEKIIGDAIVAVFGIPTRREDDALRAVQAAAESQRVLAVLNEQLDERWGVRLITRTGVATGEVIVGEATAGQHVLTGDTMSVAGAMEQNAPAQETLLAGSTYRLVAEQVQAEPAGPITPKGSHEPVTAYRLVAVASAPAETVDESAATEAGVRICGVCGEQNPIEFLHCGTCGATLTERVQAHESRKTVTIVFADPKPATADGKAPSAEALGDVMSRYFDTMQAVLARHGATVEKFIGDAVMAVFGLPVRHEDDALRAVRAAADMQRALPDLNAAFAAEWGVTLGNHIGVNTGEVVAGDASLGQRLVTGDTVNVAARLEGAAGAGQVLLGDLTYRLVRGAVEVEAVEPLTLKGKAEPVPAFRLEKVSGVMEGFERRQDAPLVGRERELASLGDVFNLAMLQRACRLATVIGDAGVGKSRLIREFTVQHVDTALVIRGRCLPYGDGITFWPLREAVRDAAAIGDDDAQEDALAKLRARIADDAVVDRLASVIGLSDAPFPVPEIFWGARRFLEELAAERPVLMFIDDIHWAESTFLDLIANLVKSVEVAQVLLVCSSRRELLDRQPEWGLGEDSLRLELEPLTDVDSGRVVDALLGGTGIDPGLQMRIVEAAAGNPLFVEQLLSMLIDNGSLRRDDGQWITVGDLATLTVPPTIQALLAARLDLLDREERAVIEPASVIGQSFAVPAVTALVMPDSAAGVPDRLVTLTGKQLVQPNPDAVADEAVYRFQHVLVRDAAYGGLLKRDRAALHERFVDWAEPINIAQGRVTEFEEIQGYHLEQAYRYLVELGTVDQHARSLGERAGAKLASAGRRAFARGDLHAAVSLLRRASAVLPPGLEQLRLQPDLGEALMELGEFEEAERVTSEAKAAAAQLGEASLAAEAELIGLLVQLYTGEENWSGRVMQAVERAIPIFEQESNHTGLALAARLQFGVHGTANRWGRAATVAEQVIEHARAAENARIERRGASAYAIAALYGPMPVADAIAGLKGVAATVAGDRRTEGVVRSYLAELYAMRRQFKRARSEYAVARKMLEEVGAGAWAAGSGMDIGQVELLAGSPAAAESVLRRDLATLKALGDSFVSMTLAGLLARAVYEQGRYDEADAIAAEVEAEADPDDVDAQAHWRAIRAKVAARRGESERARLLAEEALAIRSKAEAPALRAQALADLAEVQRLAGDDDWTALRGAALTLFEEKGDRASARRLAQKR
jgi:class 3 adenylate cyclase/tetratricopeptide (TPR) repeat protein